MARKKLLGHINSGEILFKEFMVPMDISISLLAYNMGVSPGQISAIMNGKRADTALRLAKYLGTLPELWIGLQSEFDLQVAKRQIGSEIEKRVQKHVA